MGIFNWLFGKEGEYVELLENLRGEGISLGKYEKPKLKPQHYWGYSRVVNYQKGILNGECKIYLERDWDNYKEFGLTNLNRKILIEEGEYLNGLKNGVWKKYKITEEYVGWTTLHGGSSKSGLIIEDIKLERTIIWENGNEIECKEE